MAIERLEKKYRLPLAALIMKVMVKEITLKDLASALFKENLTEIAARQLAEELKEKIFFSLENYLSRPAVQAVQTDKSAKNLAPLSQPTRPNAFNPPAPTARPDGQFLVKGASFFFSPDDEREIRELAEKIDWAKKTELPAVKIEAGLEAIISRVQINFGSAKLADRFKQILKTYLRGIRDKLETKLTLTKPFSSGGLSFDEDSAQQVMAMADKIVHPVKSGQAGAEQFNGVNFKPDLAVGPASFASPASSAWPELRPGGLGEQAGQSTFVGQAVSLEKSQGEKLAVARDAPYDFSKLAKEGKISVPGRPAATTGKPPSAVFPVQGKGPPLVRAGNKVSAPAPEAGLPAPAGNTSQMPLIRLRFQAENLSQSQKARVEDVKYVPRVMSPLDEIKHLDLINFRRLDKDPFRAVDKIKSRISLLEEEGYGKKLEGVKFWRSSPINRLYLEIGRLSISENKPVDVIIEERKIKAGDYVTAAEFKAIMDLNKSLRF